MIEITCKKCKEIKHEDFFKKKNKEEREPVCKVCNYGFTPVHLRKETDSKECKKCGEVKMLSQFKFTNREKGYKHSYCSQCCNKRRQKIREDRGNEYLRYKEGRGEGRIQEWNDDKRKRTRFSKYNITEEIYNNMLNVQDHKCAICGKDLKPYEEIYQVHIDHCHITKKVRGILCSKCNPGLGCFEDNIEYLKKAIKYLENKE